MAKKKRTDRKPKQKEGFGDDFRKEFKKQIVTGLTAAFGFLIALTWREPIAELVNRFVSNFPIRSQIALKFLTALIMTGIAAVILLYLSRWSAKDET